MTAQDYTQKLQQFQEVLCACGKRDMYPERTQKKKQRNAFKSWCRSVLTKGRI